METGNLVCGCGGIVKLNVLCKVQRNSMTWPWRLMERVHKPSSKAKEGKLTLDKIFRVGC